MLGIHQTYMDRCIQLAKLGIGNVSPNPLVGCVIVHDDIIIGEGFHKQYGGSHAEVHAIESVTNESLLPQSTLYVNLEPCAHWGKTPPCADLIIKKGIRKVIIGCVDTFSKVSGKGIERMRDAGIEVEVGIREEECRELNRRFFTFHEQKRPYVILKWAQTRDGFIDMSPQHKTTSKGVWITNEICKKIVHKWRTEEDAIMVGTNTALMDNPHLTAREYPGRNPVRIVIDKQLKLPNNLHVFDNESRTIVITQNDETKTDTNVEYVSLKIIHCKSILEVLYQYSLQSVIIEGGTKLLQSFIDENLWDEARIFTGEMTFGEGVSAPTIRAKNSNTQTFGDTLLTFIHNY